jgi:hypothetical protein
MKSDYCQQEREQAVVEAGPQKQIKQVHKTTVSTLTDTVSRFKRIASTAVSDSIEATYRYAPYLVTYVKYGVTPHSYFNRGVSAVE